MRPWRRRGELLALAAGCYAGVCVCAAAVGNRGGEGSREERDEGEVDGELGSGRGGNECGASSPGGAREGSRGRGARGIGLRQR